MSHFFHIDIWESYELIFAVCKVDVNVDVKVDVKVDLQVPVGCLLFQ